MAEIEIKKSKFISYAFSVKNVLDVEKFLSQIKQENKKASHICFAYVISGKEFLIKAFDDKEPNGTAGKPILNVIQKQNKENIMVVVVRYFGGIKLGAGGLVRAYSKAANAALEKV